MSERYITILFILAALSLLPACSNTPEKPVTSMLDDTNIYQPLSKNLPIHVHLFSTAQADLGRESSRDIANAMIKSAPHLLAVDIVDGLRQSSFTQVTLDESEGGKTDNALNLTGRFTVLHPGNQDLRVWIGFGAGKSKVCVEGELTDNKGKRMGNFSHCRSGLGWGSSAPQVEGGSEIIGHAIAGFLSDWAATN